MNHDISKFTQALLDMDRIKVRGIVQEMTQDMPFMQFLDQILVPSLERIGTLWEEGSVALSQVYMSGRLSEEILGELLPAGQTANRTQVKAAVAVLEDYHMLGKRIVVSALRASGYAVLDYNRVTVDELLRFVIKDGIQVLFVSTLMLPSALRVKKLMHGLAQQGLAVKVMVGGAPFRFDPQLWIEVGASGWGKTASDAIQFLQKSSDEQL